MTPREFPKHTPGPWAYDERFGIVGSVWDAQGDQVAQAAQRVPVEGPRSFDERRANGRLMAAAPDLLKALRAIVDAADNCEPRCEDIPERLLAPAREAIAKAEGKAQHG